VTDSLQKALDSVLKFLPTVFGALIVFIVGWIIAIICKRIVTRLLNLIRINVAFEKIGVTKAVEKSGFKFDAAAICGWIVKWFLIIVFFMAATDILGLAQVTDFLKSILLYIPNVIVAVLILLIGVLVANFFHDLVLGSVKVAQLVSAEILATITRWAIIIFAFLAAMTQLKIAASLVQTLFIGLVAMLVIALGLAFGLGGKDIAREILEKLKKTITK